MKQNTKDRVAPTPKRTDNTTLQGHRTLGRWVVAGLAVREKDGEEKCTLTRDMARIFTHPKILTAALPQIPPTDRPVTAKEELRGHASVQEA